MFVEGVPPAAIRRVGDLAVNVDFVVATVMWNSRVDGGSWRFEFFEGMVTLLGYGVVVD